MRDCETKTKVPCRFVDLNFDKIECLENCKENPNVCIVENYLKYIKSRNFKILEKVLDCKLLLYQQPLTFDFNILNLNIPQLTLPLSEYDGDSEYIKILETYCVEEIYGFLFSHNVTVNFQLKLIDLD